MGRLPDLASIDITPKIEEGTNIINGYGTGYVNISGERITHDVIVAPSRIKQYTSHDDLLEFLDSSPIVLFGCDYENPSFRAMEDTKRHYEPHNVITRETKSTVVISGVKTSKPHGIPTASEACLGMTSNHESMSFAAACRTYNVLVSEGRNVIAILRLNHE